MAKKNTKYKQWGFQKPLHLNCYSLTPVTSITLFGWLWLIDGADLL